jgi:spore germination protein GerM
MARTRSRRGARRIWWLVALIVLAVVLVFVRGCAQRKFAGVDVYFVRFDNVHHTGSLVPVRRTGPGARDPRLQVRIETALGALLAGPSAEERRRGLTSEIPRGTELRAVRVERGVVTVDLTSSFARGGGSTSMLARMYQIVYTATQFAETPQVQILLAGRRVESLGGEGVVIGSPLRRPPAPPSF